VVTFLRLKEEKYGECKQCKEKGTREEDRRYGNRKSGIRGKVEETTHTHRESYLMAFCPGQSEYASTRRIKPF